MSRRDVELVIKARDEAKNVIESINKAIREFANGQKALQDRSKSTGSSLEKLGAAFAKLDNSIKSVSGTGLLADQFNRAKEASDRLEVSVQKLNATQARQQQQLRQSSDMAQRYASKLRGAEAAIQRQRGVLSDLSQRQRTLQAEYAKSTAASERFRTSQDRLPQTIQRQAQALAASEARLERARAAMANTNNVTQAMVREMARAENATARKREALRKSQTAFLQLNGEIIKTDAALKQTAGELRTTEQAFERQSRVLEKMQQNQRKLAIQSKVAADSQKQLQTAVSRTQTELNKASASLDKSRTAMQQFGAASKEASAAVQQFGTQAFGQLERALQQQRRSMLESKREYRALTEEVRRTVAEIGRVGVPTRQMVESFERSKVAAAQAKQEYQQKRQALGQMQTVLRQTTTDMRSLQAAQQAFVGIQGQTAQALQQVAAAANQKRAAIQASLGATERASGALRRTGEGARSYAGAARQAAGSTRELANAFNQLYGGSRQSLSFLQRIRGELLALAAASTGVFALIRELKNLVDAMQTLEAAASRLNVIFDGDMVRGAQELDFIRRNADRLGIAFGDLADLYTKFAVASKGTRLEGEATRDIFIAVAEAARVNKAPLDKIRLTFLALEQMVSKGTVQMEELRRQLGDQLPGAFQLMADAAARAGLITDRFATDELTNLIENGRLSSDILTTFAEVLQDRFGPGLEQALGTITTAIGRFQNAMFQARLAVAEGPFQQSMIDLLEALADVMQSADFKTFANRLGQALSVLTNAVRIAVENWRIMFAVLSTFAALKLAPMILSIARAILPMNAALAGSATAMTAVSTAATAATAATTRAAAASTATAAGMGAAAAAASRLHIGIGLVVGALSFLLTRSNEVNESLTAQREIMDNLRNAFDASDQTIEGFREQLGDAVNVTDLREQLDRIARVQKDQVRRVNAELLKEYTRFGSGVASALGRGTRGLVNEYADLFREFRDGAITADELRDKVSALAEANRDGGRRAVELGYQMNSLAAEMQTSAQNTEELELAITALTAQGDEAQQALDQLNQVTREAAETFAYSAEKAAQFREALETLNEVVPSLARQMEFLSEKAKLDQAFSEASQAAQTISELEAAVDSYSRALGVLQGQTVDMQALFTAQRFGLDTSGFTGMRGNLPTENLPVRLDPQSANEIVEAATRAAKELSVPVEQLVQVIAERTGGTFDPNQEGGLFGLGPETMEQLGLEFGASITEQIEAVAETLREAGIQAGDGFLQIVAALEAAGLANGEGSGRSLDEINANAQMQVERARELMEVYGFTKDQVEEIMRLHEEQAIRDQEHLDRKREALELGQFELELIGMTNEEKDRARQIRQLELEAQQRGIELTREQLEGLYEIADTQERIEDIQWAIADAKDETIAIIDGLIEQEEIVNDLLAEQEELQLAVNAAMQEGDAGRLQELQADLDQVNDLLVEAQNNAEAMWAALAAAADLAGGGGSARRRPSGGGGRSGGGGGGRRAGGGGRGAGAGAGGGGGGGSTMKDLNKEAKELAENGEQVALSWQKVVETFGNLLVRAFNDFAKAVAEGRRVGEAARDAFLKFASDFLIQIGQMIVQQAIFNALRAAFPGLGLFGGGGAVGVAHTGGLVGQSRAGSGNATRSVSPGAFIGAARYHIGGIAGLRPGEVPLIAKRGEEILTRDDPRHMLNGGGDSGTSASPPNLKVVNAFDAPDLLNEALGAAEGEEVFLNYVRKNPRKVRQMLGL